MAFQPVPDTVEAIVRCTLDGQNIVNTFYANFPSGYGATEVQDLANAVDSWFSTELLPQLSADLAYNRVDTRGLAYENDYSASASAGAGVGGIAGGSAPNNVAFAIKRRSIFTGRSARGRVYLSGIPVAAQTGLNTIGQNTVDAWVAALNALQGYLTPLNALEVVVHRVSAGVPLASAVVFTVVEYVAMDLVLDSMRRRLPGRGA